MARAAAVTSNDPVILAAETMTGDLRDLILDRLQRDHDPLPWQMRPEALQRELIEQVTTAVRRAVDRACQTIATGAMPAAHASLVKIQVKNGLQMQLDVPASDPLRHELLDSVGSRVLIVLDNAESYVGERGPVRVVPDQRDLMEPDEPIAAD